jgi:hypothetical protein
MKIEKLIVAWQNPNNRNWLPIGILEKDGDFYVYRYINAVQEAIKTGRFDFMFQFRDIHAVYQSSELFPIFKDKLFQKSRKDYQEYLEWLDIPYDNTDVFLELGMGRGIKQTDNIRLFPIPEKEEYFTLRFFLHGLKYVFLNNDKFTDEKINLFPLLDPTNEYDTNSILLRTDDPIKILGYIPRIYTYEIKALIDLVGISNIGWKLVKNNQEAPDDYRFLVEIQSKWVNDFHPFQSQEYSPIENLNSLPTERAVAV